MKACEVNFTQCPIFFTEENIEEIIILTDLGFMLEDISLDICGESCSHIEQATKPEDLVEYLLDNDIRIRYYASKKLKELENNP